MSATPDNTLADPEQLIADLQRRLAERDAALAEALEQQTATAEVLQVINSSPGDLRPVFDAILEKAHVLCGAVLGSLVLNDGERLRAVATHGYPLEHEALAREGEPSSGRFAALAVGVELYERLARGEVVQIPDLASLPAPSAMVRSAVETAGSRTYLAIPLRKDGALLGYLSAHRQEVRPFTDKQITLLQNFAAQAVIAMENARLLTETREALDQQTATAEVLQVINSSPGDLAPVFDAMLEKATRLCDAVFGIMLTWDGERFHRVAFRGASAELIQAMSPTNKPAPGSLAERIVNGEKFVCSENIREEHAYEIDVPGIRALADIGGARSYATVALRKDNLLLGAINVYRQEVRPFSDKQIALLENFATQAVIAMENARLLTETREALEQQTATAEVLQVINSSPGDLAPVFDAILEKAHALCGATYGSLLLRDGEAFRALTTRGYPESLADLLRQGGQPGPSHPIRQLVDGESFAHVPDLAIVEEPWAQSVVQLAGARSSLWVPLRRDGDLLGAITAARADVRPFTDKQIALLQNFAAQAVIAIENARLINETREALEQQTATAEVLQVINSSPGDLAPVFDAMLEKAMRLCGAAFGTLWTFDGQLFNAASTYGVPVAYAEFLSRGPQEPIPGSTLGQFVSGGDVVAITDILAGNVYRRDNPIARAVIDLAGVRTLAGVALRKDGALLGAITIYRQEVRPFSDKQIELLQNFAAQAVIAMDNARLITETREALEQQTATAEILRVISGSPTDLQPTFDAIVANATILSGAEAGGVFRFDGSLIHFVAHYGWSPEVVDAVLHEFPRPPGRQSTTARAILTREVAHIADAAADPEYAAPAILQTGVHTMLSVPILQDGNPVGAITVTRREVAPFSQAQIDLLKTFADQAVIAIENVRLFNETREALEQQTATAEVLQVINSSPGDLAPVFDVILEKAHTLCGASHGALVTYDGEYFRAVATHELAAPFADLLRQPFRPEPASPQAQLLRGEHLVHMPDASALHGPGWDGPRTRAAREAGLRALLMLPLRKDSRLLGYITANRHEPGPFTDKQIALLQNFATQAVIAMENARLVTETREALEQQTATAEVLQVINSSPGDLAPVFDVILEKAVRLCGGLYGVFWTLEGERARLVASRNVSSEVVELLRQQGESGNHPLLRRVVRGEHLFQFDLAEHDAYRLGQVAVARDIVADGVRQLIWLAMVKDGTAVGAFAISRSEPRPFTDKEITLLQNFAAQAVIAMENARLIDEIRQAQAELRVTFDNMVDGVAMFDEALHLAAWNRNFQELLQLPDEVLAQRPDLDTYIRYLVERGEFGETDPETQIARLRTQIGEHYSFERVRPDGTVIEVRHNPMPGGGIVLIYSDITERKRSEAEIKAARDAAEAAYRDLKAAQASLIQAEKMASLGQLTAGIAHEIKNPLNFVNNFAGLSVELLDELKVTAAPAISALDDDRRTEIDETIDMLSGNLDKIAQHGRRADNIVASMLEHSRGSSGERRGVDLNTLIEEALNLAYHGGRAQDHAFNITLERDYVGELAPIELVPQDITRVCLNLFSNGFYAATKRQKEGSDAGFKPTLKVSTRDLVDVAEIRVRDNGIGIPPENKDKLFQPFFTTKPTGEGTGLGLSISYDIVTQQHGGTITVDSQIGEFTEFTVRLPRAYGTTIAEAAS